MSVLHRKSSYMERRKEIVIMELELELELELSFLYIKACIVEALTSY